MLASLNIQNVVLIDKLTIDFRSGLCALTGETGAGKSILLDALGLALGGRSDSGLVRKGADAAQVIAEFSVPKKHPALKLLEDSGLESDTTLILRRSVGTDGRSRAFINDQPVSIALLKSIGESLVEIHGQFETQGLLNPATHGELLDEYAGINNKTSSKLSPSQREGAGGGVTEQNSLDRNPPSQPYPSGGRSTSELWLEWKNAEKKLQQLRADAEKSRSEEDYLRQAVEDLDALSPKPGEEKELSGLRERLMHREKVLEGLNTAYNILNGEDDPVRKAAAALVRIANKTAGGADAAITALDRATAEIMEASSLIQSLSADLQEGEHDLESIDDRLHELRAQGRKHGCAVDDLADKRDELAAKLNLIEHADEAMTAQGRAVEKSRKTFVAQAEKDSAQRHTTAMKLDKLVAKELAPLKLDKARFATKIERLDEKDWGPGGMDRTRFLVATNPGSEPGPLNKIASGGEMARFMLALKVIMAEVGSAETLIFDEVDTGIGGAVADAVGERLAKLAKKRQILVVTHAPQVAARASNHYIVKKDGSKDVKTNVIILPDTKSRREEIARMLSGAKITDEARAAADKLLETGT